MHGLQRMQAPSKYPAVLGLDPERRQASVLARLNQTHLSLAADPSLRLRSTTTSAVSALKQLTALKFNGYSHFSYPSHHPCCTIPCFAWDPLWDCLLDRKLRVHRLQRQKFGLFANSERRRVVPSVIPTPRVELMKTRPRHPFRNGRPRSHARR